VLFYALLIAFGWAAWLSDSPWVKAPAYLAMGYLWMGIVTFMHDATHQVLFRKKWKNWAFGVFSMLPLIATYIAFKEDHLEHHRFNRSPQDPDAFTMGQRGVGDFVLFYSYVLIGGILTVLQFNFIYPIQRFRGAKLAIHLAELGARGVVYTGLILWARQHGVLSEFLAIWLIPVYLFSVFNSVRFLVEHYETPWDAGQIEGTRTVVSNPLNCFFWNNINYHIGHHVFPAVPWYNLKKLHAALESRIEGSQAIVEAGYTRVFLRACLAGPESIERNTARLARRAALRRARTPRPLHAH
jgi:fatty acid desaturase